MTDKPAPRADLDDIARFVVTAKKDEEADLRAAEIAMGPLAEVARPAAAHPSSVEAAAGAALMHAGSARRGYSRISARSHSPATRRRTSRRILAHGAAPA